jgi:hypothetical protein
MKRLLLASICVGALAIVGVGSASAGGGGIHCGGVLATDKSGDTAHMKVKTYDVGCNRADKGVKRYYRQTNGEQGKQLKVRGYICGPLQPFAAGKFAFQCRSRTSPAKRYKAFWDYRVHS